MLSLSNYSRLSHNITEVAYSEILDFDITAITPITPKKMKLLVAREIQRLRKNGSWNSEIIEHLLDTDGLTKPVTPKGKTQQNSMKIKK